MSPQNFRNAANDSRMMGKTFLVVAAFFALGGGACLIQQSPKITIAFTCACVFFTFLAATAFEDAKAADTMAEEMEKEEDHDHIEL